MSEREYEVTEHLVTSQTFYVRAKSRQEALEKVADGEHDWVAMGEIFPRFPLRLRDVRWIRRATNPATTPTDDAQGERNG